MSELGDPHPAAAPDAGEQDNSAGTTTVSERAYQQPVEDAVQGVVERLQPYTLADRIAQWREQTTFTPGDLYSEGRAFAFERCADEAELTFKHLLLGAAGVPTRAILGGPEPRSPIPLNAEQEHAAKEWAADDRLWTTQETVEFNLRTFARTILKSALPAHQERTEQKDRYDGSQNTVIELQSGQTAYAPSKGRSFVVIEHAEAGIKHECPCALCPQCVIERLKAAPARAAEWQPLITMEDDLSRSGTEEISQHLQSSAAADACHHDDCAGTKTKPSSKRWPWG